MNLCKLSSLAELPKMSSLYKLHLNDNNISSIEEIVDKCPGLLELSISGNKKIATLEQLKPIEKFKTLMRIDVEGCEFAKEEDYRKKLFGLNSTLACVDSLDSRGNKVPGTSRVQNLTKIFRLLDFGIFLAIYFWAIGFSWVLKLTEKHWFRRGR